MKQNKRVSNTYSLIDKYVYWTLACALLYFSLTNKTPLLQPDRKKITLHSLSISL